MKGIETTISFSDGLIFDDRKVNEIVVETYLYEINDHSKKEFYRTICGSRELDNGSIFYGPDLIVSKENAFSHHFNIVNNFKKRYFNQP